MKARTGQCSRRPGGHRGEGPGLPAWSAWGWDPEPSHTGAEHVQLVPASWPPGPLRGETADKRTHVGGLSRENCGEGRLRTAWRKSYKGPDLGRWIRKCCPEK